MRHWKPLITIFITIFFANNAHAYIDPGSASAVLSAAVGAVVALSLFITKYWQKLCSFLKRYRNPRCDAERQE